MNAENEKTIYEVRIANTTLDRFDTFKEAHKFAKNEIKESEYNGVIDIYQISEKQFAAIKKS